MSEESQEVIQTWCYDQDLAGYFYQQRKVDESHYGVCRKIPCQKQACVTKGGKGKHFKEGKINCGLCHS